MALTDKLNLQFTSGNEDDPKIMVKKLENNIKNIQIYYDKQIEALKKKISAIEDNV